MSNALIFGGMAIVSLFVFMNLGKIKASKNQTGRENRINRFQNSHQKNIIDSTSIMIDKSLSNINENSSVGSFADQLAFAKVT